MTQILYQSYSSADTAAAGKPISHDAIAQRARELWLAQGCPAGCDVAIWLEAEAELVAIQQKRFRHPQFPLDQMAA